MTWEEVAAVATLALAFVTWGLARSTRRLAREANAETRANWQPILMPDVEQERDGATAGLWLDERVLSMHVRNVGRGPALTVTAALCDDIDAEELGKVFRGRARSDVVAPGETIVFEWRDFDAPKPPQSMGLHFWSQLQGKITYGDAGYVPYETEVKVGFRLDGAVHLVDARFLGARRDRLGRRERLANEVLARAIPIADRVRPERLRRSARRAVLELFMRVRG